MKYNIFSNTNYKNNYMSFEDINNLNEINHLRKMISKEKISIEGLFDIFKKKDNQINDPVKELINKIGHLKENLDKDKEYKIHTQHFFNAQNPEEVIKISKNYISFIENIIGFYDLINKLYNEKLDLLHLYSKSDDYKSVISKIIDTQKKHMSLFKPIKIFNWFKQDKSNSDSTILFTNKDKTLSVYFNRGINDSFYVDDENIEDVLYLLQKGYWCSVFINIQNTRDLIFSAEELNSLLLEFEKILNKLQYINSKYNMTIDGKDSHSLYKKCNDIKNESNKEIVSKIGQSILDNIFESQEPCDKINFQIIKMITQCLHKLT